MAKLSLEDDFTHENNAYIGWPDLHHTKLGLTASNILHLYQHLSKFLELLIDLEAIEAEVMG